MAPRNGGLRRSWARLPAGRTGRAAAVLLLSMSVVAVLAGSLAARYGPSWPRRLYWPRPPGVVIHHSASPGARGAKTISAQDIDRWHESRGWGEETLGPKYHIGYHYVILPGGTVQPGRPEWMRGAHCRGHNDMLGICLVGNFSSQDNPGGTMQPAAPTKEQMQALAGLLRKLMKRYDFGPDAIHLHRDLGQTQCPGDRFDVKALHRALQADE